MDDTTTGIPTSTNAWGLFTNPVLLEQAGVEEFEGGSWEDYTDWMGEVTDGSGGAFWGGTDFTGRIQNFEIQLRSEGSYLFSEDGEPGFDEERLTEFWESGAGHPRRHRRPAAARRGGRPARAASTPRITASELTWDNFGAGYLGNLGAGYTELGLDRPAGDGGGREGPVPEALDAARDLGEDRSPRGGRDAGELPRQLARSPVRSSAPTAACRPPRRRWRPPSSTR